jgi:hypothetical protein
MVGPMLIYSSQTLQTNAGYYFNISHDHFPIRPKFATLSLPLSILRGLSGDKSSFYKLMQGRLTSSPLNKKSFIPFAIFLFAK